MQTRREGKVNVLPYIAIISGGPAEFRSRALSMRVRDEIDRNGMGWEDGQSSQQHRVGGSGGQVFHTDPCAVNYRVGRKLKKMAGTLLAKLDPQNRKRQS